MDTNTNIRRSISRILGADGGQETNPLIKPYGIAATKGQILSAIRQATSDGF